MFRRPETLFAGDCSVRPKKEGQFPGINVRELALLDEKGKRTSQHASLTTDYYL